MIQTTMSPSEVLIIAAPASEYCELSFAISQGLLWFFGMGVSCFNAERSKDGSNVLVRVKPLMATRKLLFSQITSVGILAKENYWPKEIPFEKVWKIPGERQEIRDGQHRVFSANKSGTLMQQYGLLPHTSLGEIAFGLADLIVGFYWQGAKWVKHQSSLGKVQTMSDLGFDGDDLARYLFSPEPGYSVHQSISTMPK